MPSQKLLDQMERGRQERIRAGLGHTIWTPSKKIPDISEYLEELREEIVAKTMEVVDDPEAENKDKLRGLDMIAGWTTLRKRDVADGATLMIGAAQAELLAKALIESRLQRNTIDAEAVYEVKSEQKALPEPEKKP